MVVQHRLNELYVHYDTVRYLRVCFYSVSSSTLTLCYVSIFIFDLHTSACCQANLIRFDDVRSRSSQPKRIYLLQKVECGCGIYCMIFIKSFVFYESTFAYVAIIATYAFIYKALTRTTYYISRISMSRARHYVASILLHSRE